MTDPRRRASTNDGRPAVKEAGIAVSLLALALASLLSTIVIRLLDGRDLSVGGVLKGAGFLFLVVAIFWAVSAAIRNRSADHG